MKTSTSERVGMALARQDEPVKDLSAQEEKRLEYLESIVVENLMTCFQVGRALIEIRERKLYRKKAKTFEKYYKELFDIAKSRANQLMRASEVIENFHSCGSFKDKDCLPKNEAQVRPLLKLSPDQQVSVWKAVIESSPPGKTPSSHVDKVVKQYLGEKIKKTVHHAQEKVAQKASTDFSEAFNAFSDQILKERNSGYKYTSRGEIIRHLDQLRAELAMDGEAIDDCVFSGGSDDANKLSRAGYTLYRMDRTSMTIKERAGGGWAKHSGPYATVKEMEAAFKEILLDDMHLVG